MWDESMSRREYKRERRREHAHYVVALGCIYLAPLLVEAVVAVIVIAFVRGWR